MLASDLTVNAEKTILEMIDSYSMPSGFWNGLEKRDMIWGFKRSRKIRSLLKPIYNRLFPMFQSLYTANNQHKRILDKTASNCFRLSYIDKIFPDAKIIYPVRDGRNSINSLINGWNNPDRFFTYNVPETLKIKGYPHQGWKFMLPPGWREYTDSPLEEVCTFQWLQCHQALQDEIANEKYKNRVKIVKLEELVANPEKIITELLEFSQLELATYPMHTMKELPIINSPDGITGHNKWREQNESLIEGIIPKIEDMMSKLGYE